MDLEQALTVSIADMPIRLRLGALDEGRRARIYEKYAAFVAPLQPATLSIELQVESGSPFIPYGQSPVLQVRTTRQQERVEFTSHLEAGWADFSRGQGALVMRPEGDPENFLRVMYAWLCLDRGALLIHGAGVIRDGRGYVFFGASGSGKTTISQLSLAYTVLSDDLVIIKRTGNGVCVFGVPFRGELPAAPRTNAAAELHGLFSLVKDEENRIARVPLQEAVARLASCVPFVMADAAHARRVVAICSDIESCVAVRELHFRRDPDFWSVIDGSQ